MLPEPISSFSLHKLPALHFGAGSFSLLPQLVVGFGNRPMVVTGGRSFEDSGRLSQLLDALLQVSSGYRHIRIDGEPSPEMIDDAVTAGKQDGIDMVVAIGGGSVIDAGKAVSAMLFQEHPVERYIEGRPDFLSHDGRKAPFFAVPTTSGTGSEATNNAVISRVGPDGFKRSLRHPAFVPDVAVVDPELVCTAPGSLTAASGMDAFTQLLEAYVSPFATPFTDMLADQGIRYFGRSFLSACSNGRTDVAVRADVAYAAYLSGIVLCNAGLGIVHGFASSVGGAFEIPHGVLCATLLAEATRENIRQLRLSGSGSRALSKYAAVGRVLAKRPDVSDVDACDMLVETLEYWQQELDMPLLGHYGIGREHIEHLSLVTRSKSNPVELQPESLKNILLARL
ncbi:MAG: iron-containing alcohol dehydrogenase [Chlorobium sp.]|uniref:iron-containing alcohol dehydrogenase n=1 Tax=Chlorobium sp. TaxID=1095 RepID=UPI0025BF8051|nr:iron-containing alcohol dehydrogenase [Chlorobium sp.]MCF8216248.1 iron-containing alcohol dehydrogenase [Chlorobium sp.]MCF8271150.1 iron-containing alcohol dehydrogenase [Chlorobium sp.]MCF8287524.1 iron-containing alcohol dehydrogenase [Chlorobium sp.]MCF8291063.1 iron-containing alcohol dehydrogenase [Chlorobium sp.]MCF8385158.1 iron-containing alcohol dehydrogenase [Chlorobium sp.]